MANYLGNCQRCGEQKPCQCDYVCLPNPTKREPARIFDDPNHPQYGPVRRMWVVLVQLDMLDAAERWSAHHDCPWDESLAIQIEHHPNIREGCYQRAMIGSLLEGWT